MADKALPSPEALRQLLRYEPETGKLFWLSRTCETFIDGFHSAAHMAAIWNAKYAGKEAFTAKTRGYRRGRVSGVYASASRVIWAIVRGELPDCVDHIDGDPGNNRIWNLRSVTHQENMRNMPKPIDNTSGVIGVYWDKDRSIWYAKIRAGGRQINLGRFQNKYDAILARAAAEAAYGFHPNHGRTK